MSLVHTIENSMDTATNTPLPDKSTGQAKHVVDQTLHSGENQSLDRVKVVKSAPYVRLTVTGAVKTSAGALVGFYVNSTNVGTLVLWDNASAAAGSQITGTITPAIGWNELPVEFSNGLWAVIGGVALDVTFVRV